MRWVRGDRQVGACLALFALAVQLVLSFGHVHLDKLTTASPAVAGVSLQQTANRDRAPPAHHDGANDVCATVALVASSVLPEPAQLTPPVAVPSVWTGDLAAVAPLFDPHVLFQARAPPVLG
jgi:hypothetical protein